MVMTTVQKSEDDLQKKMMLIGKTMPVLATSREVSLLILLNLKLL